MLRRNLYWRAPQQLVIGKIQRTMQFDDGIVISIVVFKIFLPNDFSISIYGLKNLNSRAYIRISSMHES